jgi:hypothetical protein
VLRSTGKIVGRGFSQPGDERHAIPLEAPMCSEIGHLS